jgi:hypothetical protein
MGRKIKYNPDTFPLLAEGYAREGFNDKQIADKLGIGLSSFYKYQREFSEFLESIKKGKAPVDFKVESALLKRALGYTYEEKTTETRIDEQGNEKPAVVKTVKKEVPPETGAIAFWLKNRKPEKWREKQSIEVEVEHPLMSAIFETLKDKEKSKGIKKIPIPAQN